MPDRLRSAGRTLAGAAATVVVFVAAGAGCGALWTWLWDPPSGVVRSGVWYPDPWEPGQQAAFAATGWYVVVAVLAGALIGGAAALLSARRELLTLAAVVTGSVLAGPVMRAVGQALAPADPQALARGAEDGTRLAGTLQLAPVVWWLAFPFGALLALVTVYLTVTPEAVPGAPVGLEEARAVSGR